MIVIVITGVVVGIYLVWSYAYAKSMPVPHMSDDEEDEGWV